MPSTRRPRPLVSTLLVDGMGTLVRLRDPVPALRRRLAEDLGVDVSDAEAGAALRAEIAYYRAHMLTARDAPSLAALRARCGEIVRDALPARVDPARLPGAAVTGALLGALRFAAYPDARPALLAARARGAAVVVVSNWDISLTEVLELVGLAPLVDAVITSAAVGAAKPAPEIFAHALAVAGAAPAQAVHVGDDLTEDVGGAHACGIRPVLVARSPRAGVAPSGTAVVRDLSELDALWPTFPAIA